MRAPPTIAGEYADLAFDGERRTMVVHVAVPFAAFDHFIKGFGLPPRPSERDDPRTSRPVLMLGCPSVGGPVAAALGAAELLVLLFEQGDLGFRVQPQLYERLCAVFNAAEARWQTPIGPAVPSYEEPR